MSRPPLNVWQLSWKSARRRRVRRVDPLDGQLKLLDPGVRWFVLALEALGATTRHSCSGHGEPRHWYITFDGPHKLAERVALLDNRLLVGVCARESLAPSYWELRFASWMLPEYEPSWEMHTKGERRRFWQLMLQATVQNWKKNRSRVDRFMRFRSKLGKEKQS